MHNVNSPRTDDESVEQEIKRKGLTAPRVTPADIEDAIYAQHFVNLGRAISFNDGGPTVAAPVGASLTTLCVLTLKNGFTVTGESACASPDNFDEDLGRRIARQNAVNKLWPLLGYALKERLSTEGNN